MVKNILKTVLRETASLVMWLLATIGSAGLFFYMVMTQHPLLDALVAASVSSYVLFRLILKLNK